MNDGTKKLRVIARLERAVAAGEVQMAVTWAKELGTCAKYVREIAYGTDLQRAVRRYKLEALEMVQMTVARSKRDGPRLEMGAAFCRGAGFNVGDRVMVRAQRGRIVILCRNEVR